MDKDIKNKEVRKKLYIKVYYSLLDWEWYDDTNTFRVFMHLMLIANRKDNKIHGKVIHRGEALASLEHIAKSTGLSIQNVRTSLNNLILTQEITKRKIGRIAVYRLNNYDKYQSGNMDFNNDLTQCQHKPNKMATQSQHNTNNKLTTPIYCKNDNSDKNDILKECESDIRTHGKHNNVLLTKDEYERFRERYPSVADNVIEELSDKVATGDPKYQTGHIGHLYIFARNYKPKKQENKPSFDIDLAKQRSLNLDPTDIKRKR